MLDNQYVHVAAVQMMPATGDPQANIARATQLARAAARDHGAELIIFPECTLTGYAPPPQDEQQLERDRQLAETVPGPSVNHFAKLAGELGVYIIWGLHERDADGYYNTAVLLSPEGKVIGKYRKVHINKYESRKGFTNGNRFQVWPCVINGIPFNLGLMICYDREVPEAARCLTLLGADIIAVPQATSCTCDKPIHRDQLRVRAFENEVYIAMANWAGPRFKGHSMTIEPTGNVVELGGREEQILLTAFDMSGLREYRAQGIYGRHHRQVNTYGPLLNL